MRVTSPGGKHFQSPADGSGRRRHRVTVIDTACPSCLAQPGEKCRNAEGGIFSAYHTTRQRMATRAANAIPGRELLIWLESTKPAERKRIRKAAGVQQQFLKAVFGRVDAGDWEKSGDHAALPKGAVAVAYAALLLAWQEAAK